MATWVSEQDNEDFEQEKEITRWLETKGLTGEVEFKYITSKGTCRNTLMPGTRLDSEISKFEKGGSTLHDLIGGSDGRDLERGRNAFSFDESLELILLLIKDFEVRKSIEEIYEGYLQNV